MHKMALWDARRCAVARPIPEAAPVRAMVRPRRDDMVVRWWKVFYGNGALKGGNVYDQVEFRANFWMRSGMLFRITVSCVSESVRGKKQSMRVGIALLVLCRRLSV